MRIYVCGTMLQVLSAVAREVEDPSANSVVALAPAFSNDGRWKAFLEELQLFRSVLCGQELPKYHARVLHRLLKWARRYAPQTVATKWQKELCHRLLALRFKDGELWERNSKHHHVEVFYGSPDGFTQDIIEGARRDFDDVELFGLDEGLGSYLTNTFSVFGDIQAAYLFEPALADGDYEKRQLLKLDTPELAQVRATFKKHFSASILDVGAGAYFFDQWTFMPWFYHPQQPGWYEQPYIQRKDQLLKGVEKVTVAKHTALYYLPHPMQTQEATDHYRAMGFPLLEAKPSVPFECALMDRFDSDIPLCLMTVFSSAVVMPLLAFENVGGIRAIFLSELFRDVPQYATGQGNDALKGLLERIKAKYPENVYIPETPEALQSLLDEMFDS